MIVKNIIIIKVMSAERLVLGSFNAAVDVTYIESIKTNIVSSVDDDE